jgi:2-polyprenyl-6-methoxyphenol hydroxylase-like FAD-dependent oxidoreductase
MELPLADLPGAVQNVPDPEKPETWAFHIVRVWRDKVEPSEGADAIARIKALSTDLRDPPFRTAIQDIPDGSKAFITQLHYWATVPWDSRTTKVVLAGDAAHSMLPSKFFPTP